MTENTTPPADANGAGMTPTEPTSQRTEIATLPTDIQEYIRELRQEVKRSKDARKTAEEQRQQEEQARMAANQEWEALAKKYQQELEQLRPRADRVGTMEQTLQEMAQKRIDALPKQWRAAVPEYEDPARTLAWLDANQQLFALPPLPDTGAGTQGDREKPPAVTEEAAQSAAIAARFGYALDASKIAARAKEQMDRKQRKPQGD